MKKSIFIVALAAILSSPVFAESALELCTAEAKDAGIEDAQDLRAYVDECVEQVSAEMNNGRENSEPEMDQGAEDRPSGN